MLHNLIASPRHIVAVERLEGLHVERLVNVPGRGLVRMANGEARLTPPTLAEALQPLGSALRRGELKQLDELLAHPLAAADMADDLLLYRVFALVLAGDTEGARGLLTRSGRVEVDNEPLRVARAAVAIAAGDGREGLNDLEKVLDATPRHELGRYLLALWRAQNGELQVAHDMLAELCRDFPDHALARLQLGQLLMAVGDVARAGTLFEAAIDQAPALVQAWERYAALMVIGGQPGEGVAIAKRGLAHHPGSRALLEVLARAALAMGAADMALDATRLVLTTADDDPVAHANHAVALVAAGKHDAALGVVKAAAVRFPDDAGLRDLIREIEEITTVKRP